MIASGDPQSLTDQQRLEVLQAFFAKHSSGGWRGVNLPQIQLKRFGSDSLTSEVLKLLSLKCENPEVRHSFWKLQSTGRAATKRTTEITLNN